MERDIQLWCGAALVVAGVLFALWQLIGNRIAAFVRSAANQEDPSALMGRRAADVQKLSLFDRLRRQFDVVTRKRIEGFGLGQRLSRKLERAGSKLRTGEYVVVATTICVFIGLLAFVARGAVTAVLAVAVVLMGARVQLNRRLHQRQSAFADQLPDVLQMLSTNLRAGQSLAQAVNAVSLEAHTPVKEELQRVVIEQRIGRDLTVSLRDLSDRMDSSDFEWVVTAIDINRSVGGNLATILGRVESTIRARNRIRGQVSAMSAEGKLSGGVLTALPPVLVLFVKLVNPDYLNPMFETTLGKALLVVAVLMLAVGAFWLKKISQFAY